MVRDKRFNKEVDNSLKVDERNLYYFKEKEEFLENFKNLFIKSVRGLFIYANKERDLIVLYGNNKEILGYESEFIAITFNEFKNYIDKNYIDQLINGLINGEQGIEIKIKNNITKSTWLSIKGEMKKSENGEFLEFEGYAQNITNEKEAKLKLDFLNSYDEITGFNNRKQFKKIIRQKLKENRVLEKRGALIIIDIDNFKFINDSYGHICGDIFLEKFSKDLKKIFDSDDILCRFSGDEFVVFISCINCVVDVKEILKDIMSILKKPYIINNNSIYSTASIGVAFFPDNGEDFDGLLKSADSAMYFAKSNGKNQWQMFNNNISNEINKIYSIQRGLRTALENKEMFVVFQPKVNLIDNKVNGFEALLRWKSDEIGFISPSEFIPIAESTKLIIPIGNFVLREVFIKIKYLLDEGYNNFKIAVNLSEIQLREGNLVEEFISLVKEFNVSPKYIEIEITESMIMKSVDRNIKYLLKMKELGASIALDDFGTGYSSLNHLTKLPIDVLKLDRSFVVDMSENNKSRFIIENMIQLSHKLGITVVAEGVEKESQVEYLKSINCDTVQGYYYSKPKEFENVISMLNK